MAEITITGWITRDVRFPTSLDKTGSDAMNAAGDYSRRRTAFFRPTLPTPAMEWYELQIHQPIQGSSPRGLRR